MRRAIWLAFGAAALVAAFFFGVLPGIVDGRLNRVRDGARHPVSPAAAALHRRLLVADAHDDALLWDRDLLRRGRGFLDLPRMAEGNLALETFFVVTRVPRGMSIERNRADALDTITPLAVAGRWPPRTWTSLLERALWQAERLRRLAEASSGRLTLVRSAADLEAFLARRGADPGRSAAVLGLEGAHALEGRVENLDRLFDAGFRVVGLAHFFDNEMAGSAHGERKGGLTAAGRELVARVARRGMILDLAHASAEAAREALALGAGPVMISHTGVRGTVDNARNLSDAQLRAVAARGGFVGIGLWKEAVGSGAGLGAVVRAMRHAAAVAGPTHVGLGSDGDGAVAVPIDAAGLPLLTEALLGGGFSEEEVAGLMGGNLLAFYRRSLPR